MSLAKEFFRQAQQIKALGALCRSDYLRKSLDVIQAFQIDLGGGDNITLELTKCTERIVYYNHELVEFLRVEVDNQASCFVRSEQITHKHYGETKKMPPSIVLEKTKQILLSNTKMFGPFFG